MRAALLSVAAPVLIAGLVPASCNPYLGLRGCTVSNAHLTFTRGQAIAFADLQCNVTPTSLRVTIYLQWWNPPARKWELAAKPHTITKVPPLNRKVVITVRGLCYALTRMRVYLHGRAVVDGTPIVDQTWAPSKRGARTLRCGENPHVTEVVMPHASLAVLAHSGQHMNLPGPARVPAPRKSRAGEFHV